jgi:tRNA(Ile2) C34 agmatinyltransferase TiaS
MEDTNFFLRHDLVATRFNTPTFCDHCGGMIWQIFGKQGYKCSKCKYICHYKRSDKLTKKECQQFPEKDEDAPQIGKHEFYAKHFATPVFCNF